MTEHVSIPGSKSGHDVLGGFVDVATVPAPIKPPVSVQAPSAEDQVTTSMFELEDKIKAITASMNIGALTPEKAIAEMKRVLAEVPPELARIQEGMENGTIRPRP